MEINADNIFEVCLLLVTVLAAAELQYASFLYPLNGDPLSQQYKFNLEQVNFVFRVATIPIIIMITIWIAVMLIPSTSIKLRVLERFRKRFAKELCWTLFGNLFVLEIIIFVNFSFSKELIPSKLGAQYGTLLSVLLTFPATWNYAKRDQYNTEKTQQKRFEWLLPIAEHAIIYVISYMILLKILWLSGTMPVP